MQVNNKFLIYLKTVLQLLSCVVIMFNNTALSQGNPKLNRIKSNELNSKAVKIVFQSERSKESLILANKILDSAIAVDPQYPILYTNKIQNLCMLKEYEQALTVNESLLKLQPNTPEIIMGRGLILNKLGNTSKAMNTFRQSCKIFEKQFAENHNLTALENLAFNKYLIYNRDSAYALINREKYRFQNSLRTKNQLNSFSEKILPRLTKDNAL